VPQEIKVLADGLQPVPLSVVMVFDTSESMAGSRVRMLADAGRAVLDGLRPSDQAALITFSEAPVLRCPLSSDLNPVRTALSEMLPSGRTSLSDAVYAALVVEGGADARTMILVFTDGSDNSSWLDPTRLRYVARQSDSVVYAVGLDATVGNQLNSVCEETGGRVLVADSAQQLRTVFTDVLAEMRSRYLLGYYPTVGRSGWHALDVRLRTAKGQLRARRGYYVGPPS
jgi:VWFA-related protein